MSIARLLSGENQLDVSQPALNPPTSLSNVLAGGMYSAFLDAKNSYDFDSEILKQEGSLVNKIREKTGAKELTDIVKIDEGKYASPLAPFREARERAIKEETDKFILEQRKIDPSWNEISTFSEIKNKRGESLKSEALYTRDYVGQQAEAEGLAGSAVLLGANIVGAMSDPINAATMFMGFGAAKNVLQYVGREAALNAGIEAVQTPKRAEWEQKLGNEYGLKEAATDIAIGGVAGGAFAGVIAGGVKGVSAIQRRFFDRKQAETMAVMDAIAKNPNVPSEARDAAKYISRVKHIEENNPISNPTIREDIQHKKNFIETERAFVEGRNPDLSAKDIPVVDPYILKAREIKEQLKGVKQVNANNPQELKKLLGYTPRSLSQYIKETGGIQDIGGELNARDVGKKSVGLIVKGKKRMQTEFGNIEIDNTPDRIIERAFDQGYFPDKTDISEITESDLYDAIARDVAGEKVYTASDMERISEVIGDSELSRQYDNIGITEDMTDEDVAYVLKDIDSRKLPEDDLIFTPKDTSITLQEFAKIYDDPNYIAAVEADYQRFIQDNAKGEIEVDGQIMTLKELDDMIKADENMVNAVRVCAIG
jgi:hypothetical protein